MTQGYCEYTCTLCGSVCPTGAIADITARQKVERPIKIGVAIGDVSGHGISSALLMATVRSSLRLRASRTGNIAKLIFLITSNKSTLSKFQVIAFFAAAVCTKIIAGHLYDLIAADCR